MKPTDPRTRTLEAHARVGEAFAILEAVAPSLPEPERGAALELRADVADVLRRLNNLCAFLGAPR